MSKRHNYVVLAKLVSKVPKTMVTLNNLEVVFVTSITCQVLEYLHPPVNYLNVILRRQQIFV